ncbi:PAS domain-containing protein [Thermoactinomyces sp. AMNI-1]|uniref:PAS domain-containing protein n=1 Tax=Thermoactinomyces mirandus TaxID=2756294 RepID=A0A7W2ARG4_9BACL|nr:PAS domain-containing protein [Thermoactinomyces mirandus]
MTDYQGKTLYVNDSCERISSLPREEVVGRSMGELVRQGYFDHSATLQVLKSNRPERVRQTILNRVPVIATGWIKKAISIMSLLWSNPTDGMRLITGTIWGTSSAKANPLKHIKKRWKR